MSLSLKDNQLVLSFKDIPDQKQTIPIEDVGFVVLEHAMISITLPLLNALVKNNVAVVLCDNTLMPSAMLQPLEANNIQGETYRNQIEASEPLKKNLWKQIIEAKINNQARLLHKLGINDTPLKALSVNVKSGDPDNREGVAAKIYWTLLFGKTFCRKREGAAPNNLLNYGYTILRAAVARALVGSGLLPAFGIFHHNRYNAFPLADDLMEAYRPFVDEIVYTLYLNGETELTKEVKAKLARILFVDCLFLHTKRPLDIGLTATSASLAKCFASTQKKLSLPLLE